ncbi:MAG: MFS transporter [Chloroflexota bacterium]
MPGKTGTAGQERPPHESPYRWLMLGMVWLLYCVFGAVGFSVGPLVTPILADLDISYSQMGIILGAWPLTYVIVSTVAGAILDKWGIRRSIFVGVLFIALSAGLRFFATDFATMFACVALFGLGGPMISIGAPKTISLWFQGRGRGTAVGIYMTGVWIGGALTVSGTNSVLMPLVGYNWRLVYVYLGGLALALALLWWFLARDVKATDTGTVASTPINKVFRSIISLRNVQLILIVGFMSFAIGHGVNDWLPKILEASGLPPSTAGISASLTTWLGIPTVIFLPRVVPPHLRGRAIALSSLIAGGALVGLNWASGAGLYLVLIIFGASFSFTLPLSVLILMDLPEVGSRYMGSASGIYFCIAELGGFLGPMAVGAIKDWAGGFSAGIFLLVALAFIRMVTALLLKISRVPAAA